jgi:hypothetical protein
MADNPFSVQVVNPLQALLLGQQAYDTGTKRAEETSRRDALSQLFSQTGPVDFRAAAAKTAATGDLTHSLQLLALDEAQKKRTLEQQSAASFGGGLGSLYGADPAPRAPTPNPMPVPGATPPVSAGGAVPSSARVIGDEEGVRSGLYEAPKVAGQRPPVQMAQAAVTEDNLPAAKHIPFLLRSLSDPNLPSGQREIAKTMLTEAYKNAKEPEKIQTLRALQANPQLLDIEKQLRAKTEINIDQKGETELSKVLNKGLGERINDIAKEGDTARSDLAMVGQLRDLGAAVKTGGPAAVQGWLAGYGIKVGENVGAVEAYGSIVDKLTPAQRVPGSGASSDLDVKMFKNSLPKLINTPEGNAIIETTLAGAAQYKLERAAIADRVQAGELTAKDALKQMRELPNPYENFKNFAKTGFRADPNNPASASPNFDDRFSAARPGQTRAPIRVASPAQARKLPSGTEIILPDGTPGRVP